MYETNHKRYRKEQLQKFECNGSRQKRLKGRQTHLINLSIIKQKKIPGVLNPTFSCLLIFNDF